MNTRNVAVAIIVALIVVVAGVVAYQHFSSGSSGAQKVTITEAGSSLLFPVFNAWAGNYTNATVQPAAGGSGLGISQAITGQVDIGGSDAYLPLATANANPNVMNIPILISYQYIAYNFPSSVTSNGVPLNTIHLNLSANIIAGIYMGKITNWNDPAIQAANPGVVFPNHSILPIHRSDGSGDSFMFSSFLSKGNSTWNSTIGASTAPNWPSVSTALTGNGNTGVIATMKSNPYSIGYIAATYNTTVTSDGFGIAHLKNQAGNYVAPVVSNVISAAGQYLSQIPSSGTIALQYAPGATSYPIADMEYVIVKQNQTSQATATAIQDFLKWAVSPTGGSQSKYLDSLNLAPLPSSVVNGITIPLINKIGTSSTGTVTVSEAGSSLLFPAFNEWAGNYTTVKVSPAAGGSGLGISEAITGQVDIGGSDAYLPSATANANPYVMNIPILISYQYITYNFPTSVTSNGVPLNTIHLNLSANIIAGIYMGKITNWNDAAIQAANPGVSLPNHAIIPIHRSDGSGDTFMFSSFLSKGNSTWNSTVGASTAPNWPSVSNALTGDGNTGMIAQEKATQYSIAYIAATYNTTIASDGFGIAHLKNQAGNYVAPNITNVVSAAAQYLPQIPSNGTIALQYAPGANSYPIADMEYVIVKQNQTNSAVATSMQTFLKWVVDSQNGGSQPKYLNQLDLAPLPSAVVNNVTIPLINKIQG